MTTKKILIAGGTGYLGRFITQELIERGFNTRMVVRDSMRVKIDSSAIEIVEAEVTKRETLNGVFEGVDVVISSVGITRQKDGLSYMDVDYQANMNLLDEAKEAGVKKFIYVSVFKGESLRELKMVNAKEQFVDKLKESGLDYTIIRPNGFFSDMGDFLEMAQKGKIYLFGDGKLHLNPIHGEDLAKVCVDSIEMDEATIDVGGPEILSHNEIGELALNVYSKKIKIVHLPDWIRKLTLWTLRRFTSSKTYGAIEFFLTVMTLDFISPKYGTKRLEDYYIEKVKSEKM